MTTDAPDHVRLRVTRAGIDTYQQPVVYMHRDCEVCRAEVVQLEGFSGHADAGELLDWMRTAPSAPRIVYLTHGEPDAADTLRGRVQRELGWHARVPEHLERVGLEDAQ